MRSYELQLPGRRPGGGGLAGAVGRERGSTRSRVPTLVVVGADDVRRHPVIAGDARDAGFPGARLATIEGAGHLPSLERPDELNRLLLEFLR